MSEFDLATWVTYDAYRSAAHAAHTALGEMRVLPGLYSPQLDNRRDVLVYLPPEHETGEQRFPVLYMQDGQNLFDSGTAFGGNEWQVDETLESLSVEGLGAIVVGLPNAGEARIPEYSPFPGLSEARGEAYLSFIIETVKPLIDAAFRTQPGREHTGSLGSSMGGLISLYAFFRHPEVFGLAGGMSPSLWYTRGAIYTFIRQAPFVPGKLYLDNGTREPSAARLERELIEKGYTPGRDLLYVAEPGGQHTETAWARRLPNALRFLLGEEVSQRNSHCGYCGHAFPPGAPWPRTCSQCGQISFLNPTPVAVALVPVDDGLLIVRRAIEPGRGRLALPGGYINYDETWQAACAREVREETGVILDPARIREFAVRSALRSVPDSSILLFGLAPPLRQSELPPFQMDAETLECLILYEPQELAFSLHTAVVQEYFEGRRALAGRL